VGVAVGIRYHERICAGVIKVRTRAEQVVPELNGRARSVPIAVVIHIQIRSGVVPEDTVVNVDVSRVTPGLYPRPALVAVKVK